MAMAVFSQTLGGTLYLTAAETIFKHGLSKALSTLAPDVNASAVINAGSTAITNVVPQRSVPAVRLAYDEAILHCFYLAAAGAVAASMFAGERVRKV